MSLTLIRHSRAGVRRLQLGRKGQWLAGFTALAVLAGSAFGGYLAALKLHPNGVVSEQAVASFQQELAEQRSALAQARDDSKQQINALATRLARLQASMTRLDAVGERVTELVGIDGKEFDFGAAAAIGGPESLTAPRSDTSALEFISQLDAMDAELETKGRQLAVIESLLLDKHMGIEQRISGKPVDSGYVSSYFGLRTDPFHGGSAWHNGIDFAGREGSDVMATAAGVVTFAGSDGAYGNLVEINHGDGLVTRYGHNKNLLVKAGDIVRKGQVIARMGSTGRSTAPHVHYEVVRNGLYLNPAKFTRDGRS